MEHAGRRVGKGRTLGSVHRASSDCKCGVYRSAVILTRLLLTPVYITYVATCTYFDCAHHFGKYKLLNHTFHYDTRKYSFTARIVNIWNSLPNSVVDVDTVCLFKARLDKFWMHQDVLYDFTAGPT